MGFDCILVDKHLFSFTFNDSEWLKLKRDYLDLGLYMPCCGHHAIPKTSILGTKYFAHRVKAKCSSLNGESREHQFLKYLACKTLHEMGWQVEVEKRGLSLLDELWIADIYAEKENKRFVVEIQWSGQTIEETKIRSEKYKNSGIKVLWFMKMKRNSKSTNHYLKEYYSNQNGVSLLPIYFDAETKQFMVFNIYLPQIPNKNINEKEVELEFCLTIKIIFSGDFHFFSLNKVKYLIRFGMYPSKCFRCGKVFNLVLQGDYYIEHNSKFVFLDSYDLKDLPINALDNINRKELRSTYKFGYLKLRNSKHFKQEYVSNACPDCDEMQEDYYLRHVINSGDLTYSEYYETTLARSAVRRRKWILLNGL